MEVKPKVFTIMSAHVCVNRNNFKWKTPENGMGIIYFLEAKQEALVTIQKRLWKQVPKELLGKISGMEIRIKDLLSQEDIYDFRDASEEQRKDEYYAQVLCGRDAYLAQINIEKIKIKLKGKPLEDKIIDELSSIFNGKLGMGLSRKDAKADFASVIKRSFAEWATRLLDRKVTEPPYPYIIE